MGEINIAGKLTISRPSYGGGRRAIVVQLVDDLAGIQFVEATVSLADFAMALTGGTADCELELRGLNRVGMRREWKTEHVAYSGPSADDGRRTSEAETALAPFEVDGWRGEARDLYNRHKRVAQGSNLQAVGFTRWVVRDPEAKR